MYLLYFTIIIFGCTVLGGPWRPVMRFRNNGVELLASHPTPHLEGQGVTFNLGHHP